MKVLFLFTFLSALFFAGTPVEPVLALEESPSVQIQLEYNDGQVVYQTVSLADVMDDCIVLNEADVFRCTVVFSNGECSVTASSCSAAKAGWRACACGTGNHPSLCDVD